MVVNSVIDVEKLSAYIAPLPGADLIVDLAHFQNSTADFISPDFEVIHDGESAALAWFDSDADAAAAFFPFAQSSDGGLFAFWQTDVGSAIVYLNSECEGSSVIANDASELAALVAYGSDNYAIDISCTQQDEEWDGPEMVLDPLEHFRAWLLSKRGIHPSKSPLAQIKAASTSFPDLMNWIQTWQDRKYGGSSS